PEVVVAAEEVDVEGLDGQQVDRQAGREAGDGDVRGVGRDRHQLPVVGAGEPLDVVAGGAEHLDAVLRPAAGDADLRAQAADGRRLAVPAGVDADGDDHPVEGPVVARRPGEVGRDPGDLA